MLALEIANVGQKITKFGCFFFLLGVFAFKIANFGLSGAISAARVGREWVNHRGGH